MRRASFRWLPVLLLLFACPAWAQAPATGNATQDRLVQMTLPQQRAELVALIKERGTSCTGVSGVYFAGLNLDHIAHWDLRCLDGSTWRLAFPPDGGPPSLTRCPPGTSTCFFPVRLSRQAARDSAQARCSATCELQAGAARQACLDDCLAGTATIAAAGGIGRHVAIFVTEAADLPEGHVGADATQELALQRARRACEAEGVGSCRLAIDVVNQCAAVAQAGAATFTGASTRLEDAEAAALRSCGSDMRCSIVASGC